MRDLYYNSIWLNQSMWLLCCRQKSCRRLLLHTTKWIIFLRFEMDIYSIRLSPLRSRINVLGIKWFTRLKSLLHHIHTQKKRKKDCFLHEFLLHFCFLFLFVFFILFFFHFIFFSLFHYFIQLFCYSNGKKNTKKSDAMDFRNIKKETRKNAKTHLRKIFVQTPPQWWA